MAIINIDTSDNKKILVELNLDGKKSRVYSSSTILKSEACLPLLDSLLKENKIEIYDVKGICVNTGPGSFTGLRVGAAIANALGFILRVPINEGKIGELAFPVYNK